MQGTVQKITISVSETAALIGVSTTSIYAMVREGQIPHKKVRARILFSRDVIEAWLRGEPLESKRA
jgi:excisionase family DNA binding protein